MKNQRLLVSIIVVTILAIIIAASLSSCGTQSNSSGGLSINSSCGTTYAVTAGEPFEAHYGEWGALGSELAEDNARHISVKLVVDGQEVMGVQEPIMSCESIVGYFCGVGASYCADGSSWIIYKTTLGPLSPGEHEVIITYILDEQISDGYDSNGDGNADTFGPGEWGQRRYSILANG
jgi:hypothetical protein